jgi:hypothetical protein
MLPSETAEFLDRSNGSGAAFLPLGCGAEADGASPPAGVAGMEASVVEAVEEG